LVPCRPGDRRDGGGPDSPRGALSDEVSGERQVRATLAQGLDVRFRPRRSALGEGVGAELDHDEELSQSASVRFVGHPRTDLARGEGTYVNETFLASPAPDDQRFDDGALLARRTALDTGGTNHSPNDRLYRRLADQWDHRALSLAAQARMELGVYAERGVNRRDPWALQLPHPVAFSHRNDPEKELCPTNPCWVSTAR